MKYCKLMMGIVFGLFSFMNSTQAQTVWSENFNGMSTGSKFLNVNQTKVISSGGVGGGKCLEVEYDLHKSNGSSRLLAKKSIPRAKEYTLNYDIFFTNDWNRTTGGKFHGLVPENTTSGCQPLEKDGWSCRAVFANRQPYLYTYHQDKNASCGDKNGNGAQLQKGKWYSVSLHMKVNSQDNVKDGFARLYIDGKLVAEQKNREFRSTINSNTEITKFYFSTFLGGGPSGGVTQRMHARFDNFAIVKGESIRQNPGGGSTGGSTTGCPEAPKDNWMDSYSANGKCWVESQYDHGINQTRVTINGNGYLVKDIAEELTKHPDYRPRRSSDPIYNDVQCGNGPANDAGDEDCCPGRVDQGRSGCGIIGPKWDMNWLSSRTRFGGGTTTNQKPNVTITSPSNNQTFTLGQTVNMSANASDADGSIDKVNFKVNGKYHSQDRNGNPYNSTFNPTAVGTYTIGARAFDNTGAATEKSVTITVVSAKPKDCAGVAGGSATTVCGVCVGGTTGKSAPDADGDGIVDCDDECPNDASNTCNDPVNQAPSLSFTKPLNGDVYEVGTTLIANVAASDADGDVANVRLFINNNLVRQENFAPYDWNHKGQDASLQNMAAGTYVLKAVATDNDGASSERSITITIEDEQLPKDCAGVPGGTATKVCGVCVGGTTGKSAPDADGDGIIDCDDECPNDASNTCNDPSNQAPTVSFTKPVNGDSFKNGTSLIANVAATDTDGSVSNVKLYINGSLIRQENFAPYDWNHKDQDVALQNMTPGTYLLKAVATDDAGTTGEKTIQITIEEDDVVVPDDSPIIGDDCAVKNGAVNFEVNSDIKKNATGYSWWFSGSSSSVISPANAPYTVEITMSQYYKGGEVCVGVNSNVSPFYKSYCKSVGVCAGGEELESSDVKVTEYPNPLEGNQLTIEVDETAGEILEVTILSTSGDILFDTNELVSGGQIDLSNVPAGSHILKVVTEGGVVNKRILKL